MHKTKKVILALLSGLGLVLAACTTTGGGSTGGTITIGVLSDITGPAASGNKTASEGVKAGDFYAKDHGFTIKYVVADTQSSPTGVLSAAQLLVEHDHVLAVVAVSSLTFLAAGFLTQHHVPVVGSAADASEWVTATNMFPATGRLDASKVATTQGQFFKMEGASNLGVLGYGISPQSADAALSAAASAQAAGLKAGYINSSFAFGSTNVAPIALAMKAAGIDALSPAVDPNTGLLLVSALRQAGANVKVALLATGYGGDLLQAGPNALTSAQNVYFLSEYQPLEMHTSATQQLQKYLRDAGISGDPTYAEYAGYASVVLLVDGLQKAGSNPTQAKLIVGLSQVKNFDAAGLLGNESIDMTDRTPLASGPGACIYVVKLAGSSFQLVAGADPICGTTIAGKTVSPSS